MAFTGVGPGSRVLDIGCGPGVALARARDAGAMVTGIDPTPAMVKRAQAAVPEATVVEGSAEYLPFDEGAFTDVWSISAYHHWAHPEPALDQILQVLSAGGRVYLVERKLKDGKTGHGIDREDAEELAESLTKHGFSDTSVDEMAAKRKTYLVISGLKPQG